MWLSGKVCRSANNDFRMSDVLKALFWRYATQRFDPAKKLTTEELTTLLESARLAPSTFGLQPWKFIVVKNLELRARISAAAFNQPQVIEASDLIVFCSQTTVSEVSIDEYIQLIATTRNLTTDAFAGLKKTILGLTTQRSEKEIIEWNKHQTYIALGVFLTTAALHRIDASPMEGFNAALVDDILGLKNEGYTSTILCAVGFRSTEDPVADYKKVRFPFEKIISYR